MVQENEASFSRKRRGRNHNVLVCPMELPVARTIRCRSHTETAASGKPHQSESKLEGFGKGCYQRSLIESVFSSRKERFGAVVAANTLPL